MLTNLALALGPTPLGATFLPSRSHTTVSTVSRCPSPCTELEKE